MPDLSAAFEGSNVEDAALLLRLVYCPEESCSSSFAGRRGWQDSGCCAGRQAAKAVAVVAAVPAGAAARACVCACCRAASMPPLGDPGPARPSLPAALAAAGRLEGVARLADKLDMPRLLRSLERYLTGRPRCPCCARGAT